jgi:ankyrin repeat protein
VEQNVDEKTPLGGYTPLQVACSVGNRDVAYQLLSRGARAKDADGNYPIHFAVATRHFMIASDILLFRHNVNEQNSNGHTALHLACMRKDVASVEWLLKQDASASIKDTLGNTALVYGIGSGDVSIVRAFLNAKTCDWLAKNNKGQSILHIVLLTKSSAILELLADKKKDVFIKLLNEPDKAMNRSPLFYGVVDHDKIFSLLIMQPEINLNLQDSNGDTALHLAIKCDNLTAIRLLMYGPHPVNPDTKNNEKQTPKALLKLKPELNSKLKDKKVGMTNFGSGDVDNIKL